MGNKAEFLAYAAKYRADKRKREEMEYKGYICNCVEDRKKKSNVRVGGYRW